MTTDRNLLFGVLALQADLLDADRFAEACAAWATHKERTLAEILVERGWLSSDDAALVNRLLEKKIGKFGGNIAATLASVLPDQLRQTLAFIPDADLQATLAPNSDRPTPSVLISSGAGGASSDSRDRYTTTRLHATGGLGRVWLAHDSGMNRDVALKELLPERTGVADAVGRFLREAQITGQLEHPGIVPVYEMVKDGRGASPFYTMRFIRGRTLAEAIGAYHRHQSAGNAGPLELRELLGAFNTVCQAVAYAHSRRVIHRDLKPANIVLGDFGEVIVLDWGIAKLLGEPADGSPDATVAETRPIQDSADFQGVTHSGQILGTPSYMAPEQASGQIEKIDERTDVYGLGSILFEILTGSVPFSAQTLPELLDRVINSAPPRPTSLIRGVPKPLEAISLKCLNKNPAERYPSPKDVADDVAHYLADEPVTAYRDPLPVRLARYARRHRVAVGGLALAMLIALPVLVVSLILVGNSAERERQARIAADKSREESEANFQKAVLAAELVSEELARGIKPIAGTQSKTVAEILGRSEAVYDDLLNGPNPPARVRLNKAKMLTLVADVYRVMNRLDDSKDRAGRAVELCRGLIAEDPQNREYQATLGIALHRLGRAEYDIGFTPQALATFDESIRTLDAIDAAHAANPEEVFALASAITISGNARLSWGELRVARVLYERGLKLREDLYARSPTPLNATQLATSCERYALYFVEMEQFPQALQQLRRAVQLNTGAYESDRNNQEFARDLIRTLNTLAQQELANERDSALGRLKFAFELSERFARRDPDDNYWQRESIRARWTLTEVERKHNWIRLKPEERLLARRKSVELIEDMLRIADQKMKQTSRSDIWLSDVANLTGRLADDYAGIAELVPVLERRPNLKRALGYYETSIAKYREAIAGDPKSVELRMGLLYNLSQMRTHLVKIHPDATAVRWHWIYVLEGLLAYVPVYQAEPEHPLASTQLKRHFGFAAGYPANIAQALDDRQVALASVVGAHAKSRDAEADGFQLLAEPSVLAAYLDVAEALPAPGAFPDTKMNGLVVFAREKIARRLRTLRDQNHALPERAVKLLDSWNLAK